MIDPIKLIETKVQEIKATVTRDVEVAILTELKEMCISRLGVLNAHN